MTGESGEMHGTEPGFEGGGPRSAGTDTGANSGEKHENPPPAPKDSGGFGFEKPYEGSTNDWLTPPRLVRMLGEFDLDPCACPHQPWQLAKKSYALPEADGLVRPWEGRVFCNPPYGPHVAEWVKRMSVHGNGILLIFSRTETEAWKWVWRTGDAFLFPTGRVSFYRPNGKRAASGTAPSALIAYGENNVKALRECGIAGAFFRRVEIVGSVKASSL